MITICMRGGGQRGIRTLDTLSRIHAFQACALNHSAICPRPSPIIEAERAPAHLEDWECSAKLLRGVAILKMLPGLT